MLKLLIEPQHFALKFFLNGNIFTFAGCIINSNRPQ